jgi:hypothetical protein
MSNNPFKYCPIKARVAETDQPSGEFLLLARAGWLALHEKMPNRCKGALYAPLADRKKREHKYRAARAACNAAMQCPDK